jgi:hypothetical protein
VEKQFQQRFTQSKLAKLATITITMVGLTIPSLQKAKLPMTTEDMWSATSVAEHTNALALTSKKVTI